MDTAQDVAVRMTGGTTKPSFFQRYRGFLLSPATLITAANALLLALGIIAVLLDQRPLARWLFLASAIIGGAPIFKLAATNVVRDFDLTAGVMVSIAMIAAMIVGEYSAAAMVAFMMLVGEMLENFTMARADNALDELESLVPEIVTIRRDDQDVEIPLGSLCVGDLVLVRPGGRIPADGTVASGSAAVDQSSITGESIPIDKLAGDGVFAGTLCSAGALEITVNAIGPETTLGNMITLVKEARSTQAPVERVANRYAKYLTPMAMGIAILTYFITGDIMRSITVLIVVCPCSLVWATPTAVVAAVGNAANRGVLIKDGTAMEQIGKVDIVALDKTGTLTLGKPSLKEIVALDGYQPDRILSLAASAERSSEHPLGRAIVDAARDATLEVSVAEDFRALPGLGIQARVDGVDIVIGHRMLEENQILMQTQVKDQISDIESRGNTVIPVAFDSTMAGLIVISDTVRPESRAAIEDLKALGIQEVVLISGDNSAVAQSIGTELGVDRVHAETLPEEKLDFIRGMQAKGLKVAYVGDGVNDAPALAVADVGIAMGTIGTNVAMETADIVLLTDRIERLPYLIDLSRAMLKKVRNNVIFSMSMNILAVALSVAGYIGPVAGAVMHELSALPVMANSALLIKRKSRF